MLVSDDHLPDLLREVGETEPAAMTAIADIVSDLAQSADRDQVARLVDIAHGGAVDREHDDWFWRPFRTADQNFPVTDAAPLHGVLADSCLRHRIDNEALLDALIVHLAELAGRTPRTELLHPAAADALAKARLPADPPAMAKPRTGWSERDGSKLEEVAAPIDAAALSSLATTLGSNIDAAVGSVRRSLESVIEWSAATVERVSRDQMAMQWAVAGVNADGVPWDELGTGAAVTAAHELGDLLGSFPPRADHEQLLFLVLRAAGIDLDQPAEHPTTPYASDTPEALRVFMLPAGTTLPPREAAMRVLWETVVLAEWTST